VAAEVAAGAGNRGFLMPRLALENGSSLVIKDLTEVGIRLTQVAPTDCGLALRRVGWMMRS
jgi:hypothetical protein